MSQNINISASIRNNIPVETHVSTTSTIVPSISPGARGKSAYEIWLDEGHTGTPEEFLSWLRSDSFVHNQLIAEASWTVTHNLGKYPSVTVVDSAENWVIGDVTYINENRLVITFSGAFSGKAYLN